MIRNSWSQSINRLITESSFIDWNIYVVYWQHRNKNHDIMRCDFWMSLFTVVLTTQAQCFLMHACWRTKYNYTWWRQAINKKKKTTVYFRKRQAISGHYSWANTMKLIGYALENITFQVKLKEIFSMLFDRVSELRISKYYALFQSVLWFSE